MNLRNNSWARLSQEDNRTRLDSRWVRMILQDKSDQMDMPGCWTRRSKNCQQYTWRMWRHWFGLEQWTTCRMDTTLVGLELDNNCLTDKAMVQKCWQDSMYRLNTAEGWHHPGSNCQRCTRHTWLYCFDQKRSTKCVQGTI